MKNNRCGDAAPNEIERTLQAAGRGERNHYDLVFDPATGELRAVAGDVEDGKKGHDEVASASAPLTAAALERTQIAKYHAKGGAGYAAEDANDLADRLRGRQAEVVGRSNERHGADRVVDGVLVQSKYYENAAATMRSAFEPRGGEYRYPGQALEVPKDQYDQCVARMGDRIREGRVPGHTDPADAEKLVKKGTVTFEQARNIARAGNIDSLAFDVKTGAAVSCGVFGLSFAINYAQCLWQGLNSDEAIEQALEEALRTGAATLVAHVASAQLLRTKAAALGTAAARQGVRAVARTSLDKSAIEGIAAASLGKSVYGAAAVNHVSKLLRSNAVTGGVTAVVTCTPDFYRAAFDESISWKQFTKNALVNVASVAGGVGGWMAGAAAGAAVGSFIPLLGTAAGGFIGGLLGALGGGYGAGEVAHSVADEIVEDDAVELIRVLEQELRALCQEYLLTEPEVGRIIDSIGTAVDSEGCAGCTARLAGTSNPDATSCGESSSTSSRSSPSNARRSRRRRPTALPTG